MNEQITLATEAISLVAPELALSTRFPERVLTKRWDAVFGAGSGLLLQDGFLDFLERCFPSRGRRIDMMHLSYSLPGYSIFSWLSQTVRDGETWDDQLPLLRKLSETHVMNYGQIGAVAWHSDLSWILVDDFALDFTVIAFRGKKESAVPIDKLSGSGFFFTRQHVKNHLTFGHNEDLHLPFTDKFLMQYLRNYDELV